MIRLNKKVLICTYTHKKLNKILSAFYGLLNDEINRHKVIRLVEDKVGDTTDNFEVFKPTNVITLDRYK